MYKIIRNYENVNKALYEGIGKFDIPQLKPTHCDIIEWVGFNCAKNCKDPEGKGIHFFLDDYQFVRVWNRIDDYMSVFERFGCVMTPDFSTYTDYPKALQIYNHYRKHWIGAYLQDSGIEVIPSISWSDLGSFEWCFDGEPVGGCVAVSSVGCLHSKAKKELFLEGYAEMVRRLKPDKIIFYGRVPDGCEGNIVSIGTFQDKFEEVVCDGR